eukprot:gene2451-8564_t
MAVPKATVVAPVGLWPTRREGCLNFSVPEAASAEERGLLELNSLYQKAPRQEEKKLPRQK